VAACGTGRSSTFGERYAVGPFLFSTVLKESLGAFYWTLFCSNPHLVGYYRTWIFYKRHRAVCCWTSVSVNAHQKYRISACEQLIIGSITTIPVCLYTNCGDETNDNPIRKSILNLYSPNLPLKCTYQASLLIKEFYLLSFSLLLPLGA
jgi:hypothetical protein